MLSLCKYCLLSVVLLFCPCFSIKVTSNNENRFVLRDTPMIPSPYSASNNRRSLPAVKVDPKGTVYTTQILKQQLANELDLPLRDLRVVDPSFPSQIQATITARPKAILFTLENIKVVVKNDEALVFSPFLSEVREFIPALQQQITTAYREGTLCEIDMEGGEGRTGSSSDKDTSTTGTAGGCNTSLTKMRFEHVVLEAALNVVCNNLFRKVRALSPAISSALRGLQAESRGLDVIQTQVDELLPLKNTLDGLRKRVKSINDAITDILDNDEDLEMMYLGGVGQSMRSSGGGSGASGRNQQSSRRSSRNTHTGSARTSARATARETNTPSSTSGGINAATSSSAVVSGNLPVEPAAAASAATRGSDVPDAAAATVDATSSIAARIEFSEALRSSQSISSEDAVDIDATAAADALAISQMSDRAWMDYTAGSGAGAGTGAGASSSSTASASNSKPNNEENRKSTIFDEESNSIVDEDPTFSLEMMLENYLNEIGWIASEIEEVLDTIINTEENVVLQIDLLRNRILRFELSLSIASFIVGCAALVTGLFGMNLLSHVENNPFLFWGVTSVLAVGMFGTWVQFRRFGRYEKLF